MLKVQYFGVCSLILLLRCNSIYASNWQILCPALYPRVFVGFAPIGNLSAGIFSPQPHISQLRDCVSGCCNSPKCHIALTYNNTCYHVLCKSSKLCLPLFHPESANTSPPNMVLVKPVEKEETWNYYLDQYDDTR